ncbi:TPR repeat-containing protein [Tolypothrix tenuis PCC 7101]|uniref:TPR repeat-containing protein n=1 Tax=Tolypothrix tenuis PCC 7101 TaxID=231146 RepID=A0A1Z4MZG1_9CYAN|nr:CHAT domain-containing protein [Aulosira sp. FACHB-113]BAY98878.1 TPR repeat-containing protein [Tolypothrix tenuis PCC 7101]BAZ77203.1 TPR repeat-containing protein [Aulosira laxa NIES-50]
MSDRRKYFTWLLVLVPLFSLPALPLVTVTAQAQTNLTRKDEAVKIFNLGWQQAERGNYSEALKLFEQALAILREIKYSVGEATVLNDIGEIYRRANQYPQALKVLESALVIVKQIDDKAGQAANLNNIGLVYRDMGEYTKALEYFQQAIAISNQAGKKQQQGSMLSNIASIYNKLGEQTKALDYLQQALANYQQLGNKEEQVIMLNLIGLNYQNRGEYPKGYEYFQQGLIISKQAGDQSGQGISLNNIGSYYYNLGQYAKSLDFLGQALAIRQQLGDQSAIAVNISNIGEVYRMLGQYPQALQNFQQALTIQKQIADKDGEGTTINNIGQTYSDLKDYNQALNYLQQALAIRQQISDQDGLGETLNNIGDLYRQLENYDRALEYFQQALAVNRKIGNKPGEAGNVNNMGEVYRTLQQDAKALESFEQALAIVKTIGDKAGEAKTLHNIGLIYIHQGQYPEAEKNLFAAIDIWEALRPGLSDAQKIAFIDTQANTYRFLIQSLIVQNKIEAALEVADRTRARAFVDLLVLKQLEKPNAQINIKPLKLAEIKNIAKSQNATLVEYATVEEDKLYIWVVNPTGKISFEQVNLKQSLKSPLQKLVLASRNSLGARGRGINISPINEPPNSGSKKTQLKKLYEILIQPIAKYLPTDPQSRVIFIPQSSLFLVPFPALQDQQGKYLIDKHTILTAPAIQVLDLTAKQHHNIPQSEKDILVVGNPIMPKLPIANEILEPLPGAEAEAKKIASLFKTQAIIGSKATETSMVKQMNQAKIIHFATHGLLDDFKGLGVPGAIALAPTRQDDGLLTSGEILDMKLNADLVVLSACNTGGGNITGDGVIGLSRSLITAGVKSVIVSLWSVSDTSTAFLMTEFYRHLQHNPDKAAALRAAMLTTRQKYSNPLDWAAFTLIGEAK